MIELLYQVHMYSFGIRWGWRSNPVFFRLHKTSWILDHAPYFHPTIAGPNPLVVLSRLDNIGRLQFCKTAGEQCFVGFVEDAGWFGGFAPSHIQSGEQ